MRQIWRRVAFLPVVGAILVAVGSALASSAARFSPVLGVRGDAAPAGGGAIVYWNESPWPSIWVARPDGSHVHRILRNRQNAKRARLSPDRSWVAFDGAPPGKRPLSDFDIQIVRLDGTGRRTLTNTDEWDLDAQWSPDGELLSFSRMPPGADWLHSVIWTVRRDGTNPQRIGPGVDARWSPDGTQFVFDAPTDGSQADLFVMDADGTNRRQLLATKPLEAAAGWSADGKKILFTRFNDGSGRNADVFVMNTDGTRVRRLAQGIAGSWSPDGSQIAYTAPFRLVLMSADGTHKRKTRLVGVRDPDWR